MSLLKSNYEGVHMRQKTYFIRCWTNTEIVDREFTYDQILRETELHQMHMTDVGIVLLNIERGRNGIPLANSTMISQQPDHLSYGKV